jgi:hypothetical protein
VILNLFQKLAISPVALVGFWVTEKLRTLEQFLLQVFEALPNDRWQWGSLWMSDELRDEESYVGVAAIVLSRINHSHATRNHGFNSENGKTRQRFPLVGVFERLGFASAKRCAHVLQAHRGDFIGGGSGVVRLMLQLVVAGDVVRAVNRSDDSLVAINVAGY